MNLKTLTGKHNISAMRMYMLGTSEQKPTTSVILLQKDKIIWKQPTHKTAHLQSAPTDTRPKFAKYLFSCPHLRIFDIFALIELLKIENQIMIEQTFKNIDDILHKETGCGSELDYVEQTSWILFLKYPDDL